MTAKHMASLPGDSRSHETLSQDDLAALKRKIEDPAYLTEAVHGIAQELTLELMEITYGIPFHNSGA